jgi:aminoglycoside phosphotransferase family enzyme/predicted kinase
MHPATPDFEEWIRQLTDAEAYPHPLDGPIEVHETHISLVLLAGEFAYKIKKSVTTDFLDYGTLEKRHQACCEELRLGKRYAEGLYLDVVPISMEEGRLHMNSNSYPIEFAVRMRRFSQDALLSHRLAHGVVMENDMLSLAACIARFHEQADVLMMGEEAVVRSVQRRAVENGTALIGELELDLAYEIASLQRWTESAMNDLRVRFHERFRSRSYRECHGDLHCNNIVYWNQHWVPFDGIEFNAELSWIDVINDLAFLVMDLHARHRGDLANVLLNAYLEQTGDYSGLRLLRWYLVYRSLVRAKVACLRAHQLHTDPGLRQHAFDEARWHVRLALQFSHSERTPRLWITHGLSGSGKSTSALQRVRDQGAICIRSDVERKRLFKQSGAQSGRPEVVQGMYSVDASETTYRALAEVAKVILAAGYSVVVDATFLKRAQREPFFEIARAGQHPFQILHFEAEIETLKNRIAERAHQSHNVSDADANVLAHQLRTQEPLDESELPYVVRGELEAVHPIDRG